MKRVKKKVFIRLKLDLRCVEDKGGYRISLRVLRDFEKGKNFKKGKIGEVF